MQGITWTGRGFEGMKEAELQVLEQARVQAGRVARLRAKCSVIVSKGAYKSPALTGMPGGSREPSGLDGGRRECEALLEELAREERTLASLTAKGEKIIARSGMKAEMKEFCRGYYLRRMSVEEAARKLRYEFLLSQPGLVAVAHNADDQVETVLLNLLRGTGLKGLGGMESRRGRVVRPLLWVTRAEIEAYLKEHGLS